MDYFRKGCKIYPLSTGPREGKYTNITGVPIMTLVPEDAEAFEWMHTLINYEPAEVFGKERLGELESIEKVELKTATQATITGEICGPVQIQVEGFRPIYNEVLFVEMESQNGFYEPLIGYIVLEQAQIIVDMIGHRLIHLNKIDLK